MDSPDHLRSAPAVAAFDLDGTLTDGGSVVSWLSVVAGPRAVRRALLAHAPSLVVGAVRSGTAADDAKEALFSALLAGRALQGVAEASSRFADEHLRAHVRPEIVHRLGEHLAAGHAVVLVSASPSLYVDRVAHRLGAHGAVGTELEVDGAGALTGRYQGRNCRGEEKLRRVVELLALLGVAETGPHRPLYAYGNSRGDLRLLGAADRPVDVSRLGRLGALRRFPRLGEVTL